MHWVRDYSPKERIAAKFKHKSVNIITRHRPTDGSGSHSKHIP